MRKFGYGASLVSWIALFLLARSGAALELTLENGWTHAPFSTDRAEVFIDPPIVYLKGAVAGGTTDLVTTLPFAMRPQTDVYVSVDLCNARKGRLWIRPTGEVRVDSTPEPFVIAQCFVSLDGVKFARESIGFTPIALQNDWVGAPFSTSIPAVGLFDGRVHMKGAMSSGASGFAFNLPPEFRPAATVWIPVDLCNNTKGRLLITPNGNVSVDGPLLSALCFTSLDGVSFVPAASGAMPLALINGWTQYGFGTSAAAVSIAEGVVSFKGAIATSGSDDVAFVLPPTLRPTSTTYIPVDMSANAKGRLVVYPTGEVQVEAAVSSSDARTFTSLDGASFVPTLNGFQLLAPTGGWVNGVYGTSPLAAALYDGIVHLRGALTSGTLPSLGQLPINMWPYFTTYVPVDLCNGNVGTLRIGQTGSLQVFQVPGDTSVPCFVSLDGVSFARSDTGFSPLGLMNFWERAGTSRLPAAALVDGMVHLQGAMSSMFVTSPFNVAFNLPPAMRPAATSYVPIVVGPGQQGRLVVQTNGDVTVESLGDPDLVQGFTSLDGVKFAPASNGSFTPLSPINGWSASAFAGPPGFRRVRDVVYYKGALSTTGVNNQALSLPSEIRPSHSVYLPIDLCNANKGRLFLDPSGTASVFALTDFANAQCFTSLDGVSHAVPEPAGASALVAGLLLLAGTRRARGRRMPLG